MLNPRIPDNIDFHPVDGRIVHDSFYKETVRPEFLNDLRPDWSGMAREPRSWPLLPIAATLALLKASYDTYKRVKYELMEKPIEVPRPLVQALLTTAIVAEDLTHRSNPRLAQKIRSDISRLIHPKS